MSKIKNKIIELMNAGQITGCNFKEIKTVYHFPCGCKETATFCVAIDPNHPNNAEIYKAMGEHAQMMHNRGAIKAVTTSKFV